jgi:hypothetical protein
MTSPVRPTTGVQLRGPERSEGHVSCNGRVRQQPFHREPSMQGEPRRMLARRAKSSPPDSAATGAPGVKSDEAGLDARLVERLE